MGISDGGSMGNSNGGGSMGISDGGSMGNSDGGGSYGMSNGGSMGNGNGGGVGNSDGGGNTGTVALGVGGMVDNGLFNNLVDGVDLVGGGDRDGTGNLNSVGLGNMLGNNDFSLNGDGDIDGDINVVLVDLELGDNVGLDGGDLGVSSHWGEDSLLGDSVSGGGAKVDRCRGDGSSIGGNSGNSWGRQGTGLNKGLGLAGNIAGGRLGDNFLVGLDVLVTGLHLLGADLNGLVSNNSILNMFLYNWGSSSVGVVGLTNSNGGSGYGMSGNGMTSNGVSGNGMSGITKSGVSKSIRCVSIGSRGAKSACNESKCDHKSIHFSLFPLSSVQKILPC